MGAKFQKTISEKPDTVELKRKVFGEGSGALEEEREGDSEDEEVEDDVALEDRSIFILDVEVEGRDGEEDERRDLGVEAKEEHDRAHDFDDANNFYIPALLEVQDAKVEEDEAEHDAQDERSQGRVDEELWEWVKHVFMIAWPA